MKKLLLILPILALAGCSTFGHSDLKSPCNGKTASLSQNPCDPLPINIGSLTTTNKKAA
ncbi:MAG: hypothetical protein ACRBB3_10055 [Alphaproteobacteria bacterium]